MASLPWNHLPLLLAWMFGLEPHVPMTRGVTPTPGSLLLPHSCLLTHFILIQFSLAPQQFHGKWFCSHPSLLGWMLPVVQRGEAMRRAGSCELHGLCVAGLVVPFMVPDGTGL